MLCMKPACGRKHTRNQLPGTDRRLSGAGGAGVVGNRSNSRGCDTHAAKRDTNSYRHLLYHTLLSAWGWGGLGGVQYSKFQRREKHSSEIQSVNKDDGPEQFSNTCGKVDAR